jgi:hypothetical protein
LKKFTWYLDIHASVEPTQGQRDYRRRFRAKGGFVPLAILVGIASLILLGVLWSFIQGD